MLIFSASCEFAGKIPCSKSGQRKDRKKLLSVGKNTWKFPPIVTLRISWPIVASRGMNCRVYSMADNGALSFDKKHYWKPESEIFQISAFPVNGPIFELEEWWRDGKWWKEWQRLTETTWNVYLPVAIVLHRWMLNLCLCVWRIGVLPLAHWSVFLIPLRRKWGRCLLIRFAFTLFFFVSTFCLMLMSFSLMTLICLISMCLWSHYSFVSLWKYLAVYMDSFSSVKVNSNPTEYRNIQFWIGHFIS